MSTANQLLLLLLAASCLAQQAAALGDDICALQGVTITCACRSGQEVLSLTASYMEGGGEAEVLDVSGCASVAFAFPPLQKLQAVLVKNTARATFQEKASPRLQYLALANVSLLTVHGPIFQGADLATLLFDGVRANTLPTGAFANLTKIQNVTFRDVHFNSVQRGAVEFRMVNNSELTILKSRLLGVEKSGIVVTGVTNFTMHKSVLMTVGDNGLQLDATGPVSISDSQVQSAGPIRLAVAPGTSLRFVNNVWRNSSVWEVVQQLLPSSTSGELTATGNTLNCTCTLDFEPLLALPQVAPLLQKNQCDESLCGWPAPMDVLSSCRNQTQMEAACKAALPAGAATPPGKAPTPSGVTVSPRSAKPMGPKSTATTIAVSVTVGLLLTVPAAATLAL